MTKNFFFIFQFIVLLIFFHNFNIISGSFPKPGRKCEQTHHVVDH